MGLKWLKEFISDGPVESPHIPTKEEYWEERKNDKVRTWTEPIPRQEWDSMTSMLTGNRVWKGGPPCLGMVLQQMLIDNIKEAYKVIFGGSCNPVVEVEGEGTPRNPSIRFKVRKAYNPEIRENHQTYYNLCSQVRKEINRAKIFKCCKVFMLVYESEPEMTSLNVVYNPHWRRHEGYEIMYRTPTQLRRARR